LKQELEKVKRGEIGILCIIYIDLDNFKYINDLHGHLVGDLALREIAELIKLCFRKGDVVARIGGDEFLIVVTNCKKEPIKERLEELKVQVEEKFKAFKVSISYGIAVAPGDSTDIEELVKIADRRMYSAKRAGKKISRTGPRVS
jgi:diguanylate cyclase (GGDEF)-like protein